ncbi:MAG: acylphosphatase [Candidatus Peribacteraceae bacterium]|nr:acylphosphatase [Candidatus Peribacteraceae bacterium]
MPARLIRITGRVQGVFFRSSTLKQAQALNLTGWVRNNGDGSVEVFAEGPENDLQKMISWCRRGPERARVAGIAIENVPEEHRQEFLVRPDF